MQKQNGVSTLTGIIIIVVAAVVLFGGVFAYQYFTKSQISSTNVQPNSNSQRLNTETIVKNSSTKLLEISVVDSIGKLFGTQFTKNAQGNYEANSVRTQISSSINSITYGDLNSDGLQDAFVWGTGCGASCGSFFIVVINKNGSSIDAFGVVPDGFVMSGAAQYAVKNISIENGILAIKTEVPNFDGTIVNTTFNYKLVGKNLVKF